MKIIEGLVLAIALSIANPTWSLEVFSQGVTIPESISKVPPSFGIYEGDYFIPDVSAGRIWRLPKEGGAPKTLVQPNTCRGESPAQRYGFLNGTFLPAEYGAYGGQFVVAGSCSNSTGNFLSTLDVVSLVGEQVTIQTLAEINEAEILTTPEIAPSTFGSYGGQLFVTGMNSDDEGSHVYRIAPDGTVSTFATHTPSSPSYYGDRFWGMAFAPANFGSFGGRMVVGTVTGDPASNAANIHSIDSIGTVTLFTQVQLPQRLTTIVTGIRQMGFANNSFTGYGGQLFVSLNGGPLGGGINGAIVVIDSAGNQIAEIIKGNQTDHFDPRGFYFTDDGKMLIADASTEILLATPQDFVRTAFPFSAFKVTQLLINKRHNIVFLLSNLTLAQDNNGFNPVKEVVTAKIGNITLTIPADSFRKYGNLPYSFVGKIDNDVWLEALIRPLGGNRFVFQAAGYGADLSGITNPVTVAVTVGDDIGKTSVNAKIQ